MGAIKAKPPKKIWQQITEKTWCKGRFAKTKSGRPCSSTHAKNAAKWCAGGWISKVYSGDTYKKSNKLALALEKTTGIKTGLGVADLNDRCTTTFKQVKAAFKLADL